MINIDIYTDGSCLGNTTGSPGGWAAILVHPKKEIEISGYDCKTTNNRMELTAVIRAVEKLNKPCNITLYTDSTYVISGYYSSNPKKNLDLIEQLSRAVKNGHHVLNFQHIYGHTGNTYNERCDRLAKQQAIQARKEREHGVLSRQ